MSLSWKQMKMADGVGLHISLVESVKNVKAWCLVHREYPKDNVGWRLTLHVSGVPTLKAAKNVAGLLMWCLDEFQSAIGDLFLEREVKQ